jgi:hypothetical protein
MKTKSLLSICLICSSILLFSCGENSPVEPDLPEIPELPTPEINADTVEVSVKSAIHIDSEPLSTRASNDDLYALQVIQQIPAKNELGYEFTEDRAYAHGYFDDLSKIVIQLAKRYNYSFSLAYIPNGKNLIYQYPEGYYGLPCVNLYGKNGDINEIIYGDSFMLDGIGAGATQTKGISSSLLIDNSFSPIERFQGMVVNFNPNKQTSVHIDLYRMMMGFQLNISDFYSGVITLWAGDNGHKYRVYPDGDGNGFLDIVIETPGMPNASSIIWEWNHDYDNNKDVITDSTDFSEAIERHINEGNTSLCISYTTDDNKEITLYSNTYFSYTRNTKYKLSFSLSDAIANGGITANIVEDEEMGEEEFPL